ncbi:MAG: acetyl-CoA hydrolase/transferase family protein [Deltaproteobacteria bacterium]|nr:acetyl-CoA hydrolase/transferase family protein [Deltaproteobacteria bacterium]
MKKKSQAKSLPEILQLFKANDSLAVSFATGQPMALMNTLSEKKDWESLRILCGMLTAPYPILTHPKVSITSGYYGPVERFLDKAGASVDYFVGTFRGIESYMLDFPTRLISTSLSAPDSEGYLSFGTHSSAVSRPFRQACQRQDLIAIGEINHSMPRLYGHADYGDNKIHIDELDYYYEIDSPQLSIDQFETNEAEKQIAKHVVSLIEPESTLQFGIGPIPNLVAQALAESDLGGFGIHTELFSDGLLKLIEAKKVTNLNKGSFKGHSIFTFALGSQKLYDWLDERKGQNQRSALCLPVNIVNDPFYIAQNKQFVAVNSGLMIDFAGQLCSESIGNRQYSGVGGQISFVEGANQSLGGKNIICLKSTAKVQGKLVSNIMPQLQEGSLISTPRHLIQYVVTEYGIANLRGVSNKKRAEKLIEIAHPDFREELTQALSKS